jgi:hypothetical protein
MSNQAIQIMKGKSFFSGGNFQSGVKTSNFILPWRGSVSPGGCSVKSHREELWFNCPSRRAFINITPQVEACLRKSGVKEGLILANAMHITASVFISGDEPGLHQDYDDLLTERRI